MRIGTAVLSFGEILHQAGKITIMLVTAGLRPELEITPIGIKTIIICEPIFRQRTQSFIKIPPTLLHVSSGSSPCRSPEPSKIQRLRPLGNSLALPARGKFN